MDSQLKLYEQINEEKIQKLLGNAKTVYEELMEATAHSDEDKSYCYHPRDMEEMHRSAMNIVIQPFDFTTNELWRFSEDIEDKHRKSLLKVFF